MATPNLCILLLTLAQANWVKIAWDLNPTNENVIEYRLYHRTTFEPYRSFITITNGTEGTVSNLTDNTVYSFALTAYNTHGESEFSEEVTTTVNPLPPPFIIEAEHGEITGQLLVASSPTASGGQYLFAPHNNQGKVRYHFTTASNNVFVIWGLGMVLIEEPTATDSWFWSIDDEPENIWHMFYQQIPSENWEWDLFSSIGETVDSYESPKLLHLEAGLHTLTIRGRESHTSLDKIIITDDLDFDPRTVPEIEIPKTHGLRIIQP